MLQFRYSRSPAPCTPQHSEHFTPLAGLLQMPREARRIQLRSILAVAEGSRRVVCRTLGLLGLPWCFGFLRLFAFNLGAQLWGSWDFC